MTIFELEDALVEFFEASTSDMAYMTSNEQAPDTFIAPQVRSGFIPRNEAGEIIPGETTAYPSIVLFAREGEQKDLPGSDERSGWNTEFVTVEVLIGTYDSNLDQQGYRDCVNIVQRLKDRVREQSIIRQRFPVCMPIRWIMNRKYVGQGGMNSYPYFFAEMYFTFEIPVMASQYDVNKMSSETGQGMYDRVPIPTPEDQLSEDSDPTIGIVVNGDRFTGGGMLP